MRQCLFIGRFQPPHRGHIQAVRYVCRKYGRVSIAVGSSNVPASPENPFSARVRTRLLRKSIPSACLSKISFYMLPDRPNAEWVASVCARFPPSRFTVCSANPRVRELLTAAGYELDPSPLFRRHEWQGELIRKKILKNRPYADHLPPAIHDWMRKTGEKKIRSH